MYGFIMAIHVIVCLLLVIVVLLQSGKAADLAGAFGGMGSQSTFGPRGSASFLSKMTTTLAVLFMVTSLSLWIVNANRSGPESAADDIKQEQVDTTQPPRTTQPPAAADTEKTSPPGDITGPQQQTDQPPAATTETGTTGDKKDSGAAQNEAGQDKTPPTGTNSTDSQ